MQRNFKNTFLIIIVILSFVIALHSIIPHDHHDDFVSDIEHHHNNHTKSGENPFHCHYLNTITFDKAGINSISKIIKKLPNLYSIITTYFCESNIKFSKKYFIIQDDNLPDYSTSVKIYPTRGSPHA